MVDTWNAMDARNQLMSLNIKSPQARRLAEELASLTGENMTKAVTEALRQRLEREGRRREAGARSAKLLEIGRRCAAHMAEPAVPGTTPTSSMTSAGCPAEIVDSRAVLALLFDEDVAPDSAGPRRPPRLLGRRQPTGLRRPFEWMEVATPSPATPSTT